MPLLAVVARSYRQARVARSCFSGTANIKYRTLSYIESMTATPDNLPGIPAVSGRQLAVVGASNSDQLPAIFLRSESAGKRFWEFFTANIRNRNTRRAYFVAVTQFSKWCDQKKLRLEDIQPIHVAGYIEQLGTVLAKPSVKQHLAAIRMLFDWLVTGQVMPTNPAHAVRGPKHSVKKGKTSVLAAEEMRTLLDSIDAGTLIGLRDSRPHRAHGLHVRPRRRGHQYEGRGLLHPEAPRPGAAA